MKINLAGMTLGGSGFEIMDSKRKIIVIYSAGYGVRMGDWGTIVVPEKNSKICSIYFTALVVCSLLSSFFSLALIFAVIAISPYFLLLLIPSSFLGAEILVILMILILDPSSGRNYHGLEHKVVGLLESGCEISLENLRKASRITPRCGTRNYTLATIKFQRYNLLLQRFVTTVEPNHRQLREGLEVAKMYHKKALEFDLGLFVLHAMC